MARTQLSIGHEGGGGLDAGMGIFIIKTAANFLALMAGLFFVNSPSIEHLDGAVLEPQFQPRELVVPADDQVKVEVESVPAKPEEVLENVPEAVAE